MFWMVGKIAWLGYGVSCPPGVKIPRVGGKIPRCFFIPGVGASCPGVQDELLHRRLKLAMCLVMFSYVKFLYANVFLFTY